MSVPGTMIRIQRGISVLGYMLWIFFYVVLLRMDVYLSVPACFLPIDTRVETWQVGAWQRRGGAPSLVRISGCGVGTGVAFNLLRLTVSACSLKLLFLATAPDGIVLSPPLGRFCFFVFFP